MARSGRGPVRSTPVPTGAWTAHAVDRVNALNIALMLASATVAWVAPFEIFVLSYAMLGLLHYLTQISWLHDRGYFTRARYDVLPLVALGVLERAAANPARRRSKALRDQADVALLRGDVPDPDEGW